MSTCYRQRKTFLSRRGRNWFCHQGNNNDNREITAGNNSSGSSSNRRSNRVNCPTNAPQTPIIIFHIHTHKRRGTSDLVSASQNAGKSPSNSSAITSAMRAPTSGTPREKIKLQRKSSKKAAANKQQQQQKEAVNANDHTVCASWLLAQDKVQQSRFVFFFFRRCRFTSVAEAKGSRYKHTFVEPNDRKTTGTRDTVFEKDLVPK